MRNNYYYLSYTILTRERLKANLDQKYLALINRVLRPYITQIGKLPGQEKVLERMRLLLDSVGNPQQHLRVIHIAGTSGKTSTAYYISSLLLAAGCSVGLAVSPHVDKVTERLQVNGLPLNSKQFYLLLQQFMAQIKDLELKLTYFELIYAFGYWLFMTLGVDYAVIETGVGGLFDATNIVTRQDKVCVITDIGYDHMALLGNTLDQIAAQKAGIIHDSNPVFVAKQPANILNVIKGSSVKNGCPLTVIDTSKLNQKINLPAYQIKNWLLAKAVYDYLTKRDSLILLTAEQLVLSQKVYIPARMEIIKLGDKTVVMDGAHNGQKMAALVLSIKQLYPNQQATIVISLKNTKDTGSIGQSLKDIAAMTIVTNFYSTQDLLTKAYDPSILAGQLKQDGLEHIKVEYNQNKAMIMALNQPASLVIVTGSFYLLSQLRASFFNKCLPPPDTASRNGLK